MGDLYNLVQVNTATVGTGSITLGSAVSGFLTFAQASVITGTTVSYGIIDGSNREVGTGTYTSASSNLTRTVITSTNGNAAISLSGNAQVYLAPNAADIPKITVQTLASGPPSLPNTGDIWIASSVDTIGTRWKFQYNGASASTYKWEFIGGFPLYPSNIGGNVNAIINTQTQVGATGTYYAATSMSVTAVRDGDYTISGFIGFNNAGTTTDSCSLNTFVGSAISSPVQVVGTVWNTGNAAGETLDLPGSTVSAVGAGTIIGICGTTGTNNGVFKFGACGVNVTPRRII